MSSPSRGWHLGLRGAPLDVCLLALCVIAGAIASGCGPASADAPEQPIAFNHEAHAEAEIDCLRCHRGAESARQAGLPGVRMCASCHRRVATDSPEVAKVMAAFEAGEPLRWVKMHHIPADSAVQFHHGAHTQAGITCDRCHGDVATMQLAEPVLDVARMGWCLECHRENEASDDCLTCHY